MKNSGIAHGYESYATLTLIRQCHTLPDGDTDSVLSIRGHLNDRPTIGMASYERSTLRRVWTSAASEASRVNSGAAPLALRHAARLAAASATTASELLALVCCAGRS